MDELIQACSSLKAYFSHHRLFRILLPLDNVIIIAGLVMLLLDYFGDFKDWGILWALGFWVLAAGLALAFANANWIMTAAGLFIYGALCFIYFLYGLFKAHSFYADELIFAVMLGWIGWGAVKRVGKHRPAP